MRILLLALLALAGCSSAAQRYRADSLDCVARYDTRAEMDACRAAVRAKYGVTDGGAK
jgi:hypothetical protein